MTTATLPPAALTLDQQNELVVANLDVVRRVLYHRPMRLWRFPVVHQMGREDAEAVAQHGLVLATRHYDPSRNPNFALYAQVVIKRHLLKTAFSTRLVRLPQRQVRAGRFTKHRGQAEQAFHVGALAEQGAYLPARTPTHRTTYTQLYAALDRLSAAERQIVAGYAGIGARRTLKQLAATLGHSIKEVRLIRHRALRKLGQWLEE